MAYARSQSFRTPVARLPKGPADFVGIVASTVLRGVETVLAWQERASERQHLAGLDDHYLKDMGITRADVEWEASKPFWRV